MSCFSHQGFCVVVVKEGAHGILPTAVGYAMRGGGGWQGKNTK